MDFDIALVCRYAVKERTQMQKQAVNLEELAHRSVDVPLGPTEGCIEAPKAAYLP